MITNIPRGTKDVLPSQINKWRYVENTFRSLCARYGFGEIRTPVFEHTELFARGVGDTTDIVEKQMYSFKDYGQRDITLKPEGTSPVVRSFVENKLFADVMPAKYYYITPCFRYEKPQSGRLREFHQCGIEVFGSKDMMADAEVIALAKDFLELLGIRDLELRINSIGCPNCRAKYREALQDFLRPSYDQFCDTCKGRFERNPMRILDCKSPVCQELAQGAPHMLDYLCEDCAAAFEDLKANLTAMELDFTVDPGIVRGLDYYTKTAFEFVSNTIGAQGTVCGGGRYDHLIEEVGGPSTPGVGFGLGIERLLLVMESNGIEIPADEPADVLVAVMGDRARAFGQKLVHDLRKAGKKAALDLMARNLKGQLKYADRIHAKYTIVIGDNELDAGKVALKTMAVSQQREIPIEDILKEIEN
ncbi:histidine--tRNA ligase [Bacilliculturomica massiliensis]|uniref:histidine--tRNA ligase n=1 Tax=Bacilliculturomica massiliensis TaxID=1917867 RepID=UPI001030FB40|nr:histidine--tRNA ligase [Bacilliculturomica massiliensis]